jgi:phosphatidylinositol glycan class B
VPALLRLHPWLLPALAGLLLRVVATFTGHGVWASDDYFHALEPAWRWLEQPDAPLPTDFRSSFLPRILWLFFLLGEALGIPEPVPRIQWVYGLLGLWSVSAIPAAWLLVAPRLGNPAALGAAWLVATHALLPRISTRALGEAVCAPLILWTLVLVEWARRSPARTALGWAFLSGLCAGVAAMLRFQAGVVFAVVFLLVWVRPLPADHPGPRPGVPALVGGLFLGGLVAMVGQGLLDLAEHGEFLASPVRYVAFNVERSASYGVEPWHLFLGMFLGLSLPPATVALAAPVWRGVKAMPLPAAVFVAFVATHSAVGHKEDRFMFPLVPLFCVFVGPALVDLAARRPWQRASALYFWAVNAALLAVMVVSDGKRNVTTPLLEAAAMQPRPVVVGLGGVQLLPYYLGRGGVVKTLDSVEEAVVFLEGQATPAARLCMDRAPRPYELDRLRSAGWTCGAPSWSAGDVVDRTAVWLNPSHNTRRAPVAVVDCRRPLSPP